MWDFSTTKRVISETAVWEGTQFYFGLQIVLIIANKKMKLWQQMN